MLLRSPFTMEKNKDQDVVISINDVWVKFRIYHDRKSTLKERIVKLKGSIYEDFWALKGVTLEIKRGEAIGIIGHNGSGKSTLLKCIAGLLQVNKGGITVNGRISPLLELGAGFHPDLTGRENIYLNGAILGITRRQIKERYNDIVKFAELENFIDTPVRNYSSGMYVRLGFAIAVHSDPDILLIDEVLAVGDLSFQEKCFEKINEHRRSGKTLVFVSHSPGEVKQLCKRTIWLDHGVPKMVGETERVLEAYSEHVQVKAESEIEQANKDNSNVQQWGTQDAAITQVRFLDQRGEEQVVIESGDPLTIELTYESLKPIEKPVFGIGFYTSDGIYISGPNTKFSGYEIDKIDGAGVIKYSVPNLWLLPGTYLVSVALYDNTCRIPFDHQDKLYRLKVVSKTVKEQYGFVYMPSKWER